MSRSRPFLLALLVLASACGGGDPSGPSTGILSVSVTGLPAGAPADVTVSGPSGYSRSLASSQTIPALAPGAYTITAQAVNAGGQAYQPSQFSQSIAVSESSTPTPAQVEYGPVQVSLSVTIGGLPPGVPGAVTVSGPGGFSQPLTATTTLSALAPGVYTVTAESVSPAGVQYNPSPATQTANLTAGGAGSASVSYSLASASGLNLRIDGMYLTQSVQAYAGTVPLVKDRDGFLRIFVTATQSNVAAPAVRVRFYSSGVLVSEATIPAPGAAVPQSPNEATLASSWNVAVPKALIQPNLSILAELDPTNTVAETDEGDNAFPASGTPLAMDVRITSTFSVRMVPIIQSANGRTGSVSNATKDGFLTETMRLHPLAGFNADLRAPYTTNAPAVDKDNANGAWTKILGQLDALRTADGSSRYYFGVLNTTYNAGVAGIGYVGGQAALGWDKSGADQVAAHEWGHNWGRQHAPCGNPGSPDPQYPYAGGAIGVYGFDVQAQTLVPSTAVDLMGYCSNEWISDYTYKGVLAYRAAEPDVAASFAQAAQPCLLVWGRIIDGQPVLEPAFRVITRPSLPSRAGAYSVEGTAADGSRLFRLSFTPKAIADDPGSGTHFAFAVPLQPDRAARLSALRLTAPGAPSAVVRASAPALGSARSSGPAEPAVRAARLGAGRVALSWNAATHPMAMVRDPSTGQVVSFAEGGQVELTTSTGDVDVQLSDGLGGPTVRVAVPAR